MYWEWEKWGAATPENLRRLVPQAQLVAVTDVAPGRARQIAAELEIENSYSSLEAMLECKGLDAVVITTPDKFHAAAVKTIASAGKAMLCEKPLALTLPDAHDCWRRFQKRAFVCRWDLCDVTTPPMPQQ